MPKELITFADVLIPLGYQVTTSDQQFLLYDNNDHDNRLLIFARKEQLDLLNGCEIWCCDSTFAVHIWTDNHNTVAFVIFYL